MVRILNLSKQNELFWMRPQKSKTPPSRKIRDKDGAPRRNLSSLQSVRPAEGENHSLRQAFNHRDIAFVKGAGLGGKDFEQTHNIALIKHGRGENGANIQLAAGAGIDSRVELRVIATHRFPQPDAFATET